VVLLSTELEPHWHDLVAEAGLTCVGIHPDQSLGAVNAVDALVASLEGGPAAEFVRRLRVAGVDVEYELHALAWLLPRSQFDLHPDWFRMDARGERTPDVNACPSAADALAVIEERSALLAARLAPSTGRHHLWVDDLEDSRCRCPRCAGLSTSDQYLVLYNAIARGVRRTDPRAMQSYLAYYEALEPPAVVKPGPGIFLEFAPVRRDSAVPIGRVDCPANVEHVRHLDALLGEFDVRETQVLEYWMDNSRFSGWKKPATEFPFHREAIAADARWYHDRGIRSMTSFACFYDREYVGRCGLPPIGEYGRILASIQ
jgi:hypothetical protein